ncbi:MAG: zinc-ribbon domain-containing protein [Oceanococcus sp.]
MGINNIECPNCHEQMPDNSWTCPNCGESYKPNNPSREKIDRVSVVDFDVPFGRMVMLMVKMAFAAIPAVLIIWLIIGGFGALISVLGLM